jgi:hypothetical protein
MTRIWHEAIATAWLQTTPENVATVFMARIAVVSVLLLPSILFVILVWMLAIR